MAENFARPTTLAGFWANHAAFWLQWYEDKHEFDAVEADHVEDDLRQARGHFYIGASAVVVCLRNGGNFDQLVAEIDAWAREKDV